MKRMSTEAVRRLPTCKAFASIDLRHKTLIFGNILFSQEVNLEEIKIVKVGKLLRKASKIVINGKFYYIQVRRELLEDYLNGVVR